MDPTLKLSKTISACIAVGIASFLVSGCASQSTQNSGASASSVNGENVPKFTGAWSDEFKMVYAETTNDFERLVLKDGKITESEVEEMKSRFGKCLTSKGFTEYEYFRHGGFAAKDPDSVSEGKAKELMRECEKHAGEATVGYLYYQIERNPDNLDENKIIAECLVRNGVVEKSYSAKDYQKESETDNIKFIPGKGGDAVHHECQLDPLGILD